MYLYSYSAAYMRRSHVGMPQLLQRKAAPRSSYEHSFLMTKNIKCNRRHLCFFTSFNASLFHYLCSYMISYFSRLFRKLEKGNRSYVSKGIFNMNWQVGFLCGPVRFFRIQCICINAPAFQIMRIAFDNR